jgi:hypothetical protein
MSGDKISSKERLNKIAIPREENRPITLSVPADAGFA